MARANLDVGLYGCQAEARGVTRGILQLARFLNACERICCLAAEQVRLGEQAQHLHSSTA